MTSRKSMCNEIKLAFEKAKEGVSMKVKNTADKSEKAVRKSSKIGQRKKCWLLSKGK